MTSDRRGISPAHFPGVGVIRGRDVERQSDGEQLFGDGDSRQGNSEKQAGAEGAAAEELYEAWADNERHDDDPDDVDAEIAITTRKGGGIACEEAAVRLPSTSLDPTPEERNKHSKTHVPHQSIVLLRVIEEHV